MSTQLGKELRKIRLDRGQTLYDMAEAIGISTSMLSSIETGKKAAPPDLVGKLAAKYAEVRLRVAEFTQMANQTRKEVRLKLDERADATELAVAFARNFEQLSSAEIKKLMAIFEKS